MSVELAQLFEDLDLEKLRLRRPGKFIFFCGGAAGSSLRDRVSLRHFLLTEIDIAPRLKAKVVLAEKANQIYRDTKYRDLISFEEDIAVISSLVLVIAESAGSFAELGSFSSIDRIRRSLLVIMQEKHESTESFIRFGPVQRVKNEDNLRVAFWPWRTNGKNKIIKSSASPHVRSIVKYINDSINKSPLSISYNRSGEQRTFLLIFWIIHLSTAVTIEVIKELLRKTGTDLIDSEIRKKLYCMKIANWVGSFHYVSTEYFFAIVDIDPIEYSFKVGVRNNDSVRRKFGVAAAIKKELGLPQGVRRLVLEKRGQEV